MGKFLLGTDNGATVAKAALFAMDGREVAAAGCKAEMFSPQPGHFERDMQRLWRATAESIRLTGGGARSRQWVQIFADVFQTPVEIPSGTELGALGAAKALCPLVATKK